MAATHTPYTGNIKRIATRYRLGVDLVTAIVLVESSGQTDAFRHEPNYYRKYIKGKPEWALWIPRRVASSYGLMQVMYPTALMNGWEGDPEEMFLPDVGLNAGCSRLEYLKRWALREWESGRGHVPHTLRNDRSRNARVTNAVLAAYNGGKVKNEPWRKKLRTRGYVVKVKARMTRLRT